MLTTRSPEFLKSFTNASCFKHLADYIYISRNLLLYGLWSQTRKAIVSIVDCKIRLFFLEFRMATTPSRLRGLLDRLFLLVCLSNVFECIKLGVPRKINDPSTGAQHPSSVFRKYFASNKSPLLRIYRNRSAFHFTDVTSQLVLSNVI